MTPRTNPDHLVVVPTTPEEITAKWLSRVLEKPVMSATITNIIPGTATKVLVEVTYDGRQSDSQSPFIDPSSWESLPAAEQCSQNLCIKGGLDPSLIQALPFVTTIYKREVDFYTKVVPALSHDITLPRVYWPRPSSPPLPSSNPDESDSSHPPATDETRAEIQTRTKNEIQEIERQNKGLLIMDDLSSIPGVVSFGTPTKPWCLGTLHSGLEQLAALHASTWNDSPDNYPWLPRESHYDAAILHLMQTYESVVRGADRPAIPEYMKDQRRMTKVLVKHFAGRNERFGCLVHGDAHVSNTYLVSGIDADLAAAAGGVARTAVDDIAGSRNSDGHLDTRIDHAAAGQERGNIPEEECPKARFLDWQMIHLGSCFHDVAYLIVGALDIPTRREKEMQVLGYYLDMLQRFGGPKLSIDDEEVLSEYKRGMLAGIGPIMCPYEMQPREWVYPMAERYAAALDDHRVLELVEGM